jgi:hypothetical protein
MKAYYKGLKPKKLKKKPGRIACVITTFFGEGRSIYAYMDNELNWTGRYEDDKLSNFKFTIKCYQKFLAGMDYDLILVDNSSTDYRGLKYLKTLPHKVYKRENNGFSFGGYKWFYEKYGKNYDYFLFHEQDFCPAKDGWLSEIYVKFLGDNIGAVGNVIEKRYRHEEPQETINEQFDAVKTKRNVIINLDGAYTFTSKEVLKQTKLRVIDGKIETSTLNEILFAQPILDLGYKIASFGNRDFTKSKCVHTYGSRKGDTNKLVNQYTIAPIVDSISRITSKEFNQYFNERGII